VRSALRSILPLVAATLWLAPAAPAVTLDWVTVGDPGNAADTTGFGSVSEVYRISETEVTNAQYAEFLNAKAASDPLALYNTSMGSGLGGITRSGSSGSFTYSAIAGREDMPVNFVSFYDSLRFANWLHNGQGSGDTETGAYTLLGGTATPSNGLTVTRNAGASIFLTSEDEWYKAAYYDALSISYFDYPAGTNTPMSCSAPTAAANHANCGNAVGDLTDVGSYTGSASPAGTFDQGGNVWEWNEAIIGGSLRGIRGGSFVSNPGILAASSQGGSGPSNESGSVGFRVASPIPEPGTGLLVMAGVLGLAGWRRRRAWLSGAGTHTLGLATLGVALLWAPASQALPVVTYSGSVTASDGVLVPEITEVVTFFPTTFTGFTMSSTSITGFQSIPDSPNDDGQVTVTSPDTTWQTLDVVRTGTSADITPADPIVAPTLDFDIGLQGVDFRSTVRSSITPGGLVAERFDGRFTLTPGPFPLDPAVQAIFDELDAVTGSTGAPEIVLNGTVTGVQVNPDFTQTVFFTTTLTPVALVDPVAPGGSGQIVTSLLGGTGAPGGLTITFQDSGSGGDITADFSGLGVSEVEALLDDPDQAPAGLGIFFAGGEAQVWEIDFSGTIDGPIELVLSYDDTLFGPDFDESVLGIAHKKDDGTIETFGPDDVLIDDVANTITFTTDSLSPFFLTAVPEPGTVSLLAVGLAFLGARRRGRGGATPRVR